MSQAGTREQLSHWSEQLRQGWDSLRGRLPGTSRRLVALEWNATEARIVVTSARRGTCTFQDAFSLPLAAPEAGTETPEAATGRQIAAALAERGLSHAETLVAVGRTNIELRQLTLPPAPDEELPDMVRMQAMRDLSGMEESWPLDFIPAERTAGQPVKVLAAAIDPASLAQLVSTCQTAGLKPQRIVLRPCAAASLLGRAQPQRSSQLCLLVDLLLDEADLTVVCDGKVVFLRTVRLPGDPLGDSAAVHALMGEVRRTMAAAASALGARRFDAILLCGVGQSQSELARLMSDVLLLPAELFDPFCGPPVGPRLAENQPERPGRFAALLGMLLDEVGGTAQPIDFLHPRRTPPRPSRNRRYYLGAAAAAAFLTAVVVYQWWSQGRLAAEVDDLRERAHLLDAQATKAEKTLQQVGEIVKWKAGEIVWLDELREFAVDFPPAEDAMLTRLVMGNSGAQGGEMKLEGMAQTAASVDALEQRLRDQQHQVEGKGRSLDNSQRVYSWRFVSSLFVKPGRPLDAFEKSLLEHAGKGAGAKAERPSARREKP
jgi:hypothetical protein